MLYQSELFDKLGDLQQERVTLGCAVLEIDVAIENEGHDGLVEARARQRAVVQPRLVLFVQRLKVVERYRLLLGAIALLEPLRAHLATYVERRCSAVNK